MQKILKPENYRGRIQNVECFGEETLKHDAMITNISFHMQNREGGTIFIVIGIFLLWTMKKKKLLLEASYVAFSRFHHLEDILSEMPFAKNRHNQIIRIEALADRLAFHHYLRQLNKHLRLQIQQLLLQT